LEKYGRGCVKPSGDGGENYVLLKVELAEGRVTIAGEVPSVGSIAVR